MLEQILTDNITSLLLSTAHAAVTIIIAFMASIFAYKAMMRFMKPTQENAPIVHLLCTSVKNIIIMLGCVSALASFGINIQSLVAGLGLTGFALGFAFKDALANIISGVFILLYRPFKIGDYVKLAVSKTLVDEGTVIGIDLRYTKLETETEITLVPNAAFFVNSIVIYKNK
ncbi:mechanosensitive ion channel family protein [Candidatus Babeliales bacterium]|nr:mechanosensitive ion channel family protein [Candidatus Babeliales bacterium]